jgi:uncharacterized protein (TIGR03435 family)
MTTRWLLIATATLSFAADRFEVASVKIAAPIRRDELQGAIGARTGGPGSASPERIAWRATILAPLIPLAYGVKDVQIVAPDWVTDVEEPFENGGTTWYDISATMAPGATMEQMHAMLRNLLEERFGLKSHREMRERTVYTLSVGREQ